MKNQDRAKNLANYFNVDGSDLNIQDRKSDVEFAWYVGSCGNNDEGEWTDFSEEYISQGIWENRWDNKFVDKVNSIKVGDHIVIKAAFTQKNNLPFENHGKTVSAMRLKAIGIVTGNENNGKRITVKWSKLEPNKTWYGLGTLRETIHVVKAQDGYVKKQLLDFTFANANQDYSICEDHYSEEIDEKSIDVDSVSEVTSENEPTGLNDMVNCLSVHRDPINNGIHPLNSIIYGAPGTGKTYAMAEYALAIIENREVDKSQKTKEQRKAVMAKYNGLISEGRIVFTTFHQSYGYEEFIQGLRPDTKSKNLSFIKADGVFKRIADKALYDDDKKYVIIIDEINRANISKVFGELITLIEADKRWGEINETCATLQSGDVFAVPNNLYILGTMNSADKSISLIDAALRRRFEFIEQAPNSGLVEDIVLKGVLEKLNKKLAYDLESSDLLIGHSYFIGKKESHLCQILNNSVIPLLYEYYYDNKKKVLATLSEALQGLDKYKIQDNKISRIRVEKENGTK